MRYSIGYLTKFESQAKALAETVPTDDLPLFLQQVQRADAYLQNQPLQCRGAVIFAGPDTWELIPLQVEVEDEVRWGTPALAQLFWLLDEHKPHSIVLGKTIPYFLIGCVDATMLALIGTFWFGVPFRGHVIVLAIGVMTFLLAALGLGLLISTVSATQEQARNTAFFFTMPATTLSGFGTPISSSPCFSSG